MFTQITALLCFVMIVLATFGLGRPIVRVLKVGEQDRLTTVVWSFGLGTITAGFVLGILGLVGGLYVPLINVLTMAGAFWGVGELLREYTKFRRSPVTDEETPDQFFALASPAYWMRNGLLIFAAVACFSALIGAMAPPTAGDSLCYHLDLPKTFLADHCLSFSPYNDNATFPLLVEMLYLWGLSVDGYVTAQLIHWGFGLLLGLATVELASCVVGRSWAWMAGSIVVLIPGVNNQMTAPLNDVALALFCTLAISAWWRCAVNNGDRRWFIMSGLAAGGALGTKYVAGVFAIAVAATWLWTLWRQAERRRYLLRGALIVSLVASTVGGMWYVRAAWYRGNPVHPFLSEVFCRSDDTTADLETLPDSKSPLGRSPLALLTAPWKVTMQPDRFGGRGHQLGVLMLAALPGLLLTRRLRGLGILLGVSGVYGILWFLLRQNVRFLFPIVPLFSIAIVWVWIEMRRMPLLPRSIAAFAQFVVLLAFVTAAVIGSRNQLAVSVGIESHEEYLSAHEPSFSPAADVNVLPPDVHLLTQDYRTFYFNCRTTRENIFRRCTHYDRKIKTPAELSHYLRQAGFTHVLLAKNLTNQGIQFDPTLARLIRLTDPDCPFKKLSGYQFRDVDGAVRQYQLVAIR